jgi:hypothetical protein
MLKYEDVSVVEKVKFYFKHKLKLDCTIEIDSDKKTLLLCLLNLKNFKKDLIEQIQIVFSSRDVQYFIKENTFLIVEYTYDCIESYYKVHYSPPSITHTYLPFAYKGKEKIRENIYKYIKVLITDDFGKLKKGEEYEHFQVLLDTNIGEGVITLQDLSSVWFTIKAEPIMNKTR